MNRNNPSFRDDEINRVIDYILKENADLKKQLDRYKAALDKAELQFEEFKNSNFMENGHADKLQNILKNLFRKAREALTTKGKE